MIADQWYDGNCYSKKKEKKKKSEMELAPRYTLFTLLTLFTLFTLFILFILFKLLCTAKIVAPLPIYVVIMYRMLLDLGFMGSLREGSGYQIG